MKFLLILLFSCISGFFYRCGGAGKEGKPRWIPKWLRNTKARDLGCPLIALIALWFQDGFKLSYWWAYVLTFGAMFGALTTYWDFLNKGQDNFFLHGAGIGLATLPLILIGVHLTQIIFYSLGLGLTMGIWSAMVDNDVWEEFGRGFFIISLLTIII